MEKQILIKMTSPGVTQLGQGYELKLRSSPGPPAAEQRPTPRRGQLVPRSAPGDRPGSAALLAVVAGGDYV